MSIIYLDVNLSNSDSGVVNLSKIVSRSSPILENPDNYYVAVARLVCPTSFSIWLWDPLLLANGSASADGYNTIYSIVLTYGTTSSPITYLRVIPSDLTVSAPPVPVTIQPVNGWGAVYNYQTIVSMLNVALASAYAALVVLNPSLLPTPPMYVFDPETSLFFIQMVTGVSLYFNNEYRPYLAGFRYNRLTSNVGTASGKDLLIVGTGTVTQGFVATWCFMALSSVQVVSSLPTLSEFSDLPLYLQGSAPNNATSQILTDFAADYSSNGAGSFLQPIVYTPPSVIPGARFISMSGKNPIMDFSIAINWVDTQGIVRPMQTIGAGQNASIKLVFVKKSIIDNQAR